jgi:hypothetical protein
MFENQTIPGRPRYDVKRIFLVGVMAATVILCVGVVIGVL